MVKQKTISNVKYSPEVISRWVKPEGYDLSVCTITDHMNHFSFNLVLGSYDEFKKFLKKEYDFDTTHSNAVGMYCGFEYEKCRWNFILITENNWKANDYGVICHELHHLVHLGLDEKGISYGIGGEEMFAHMQGHFMELVIRAFVHLNAAKILEKKKLKTKKAKHGKRK